MKFFAGQLGVTGKRTRLLRRTRVTELHFVLHLRMSTCRHVRLDFTKSRPARSWRSDDWLNSKFLRASFCGQTLTGASRTQACRTLVDNLIFYLGKRHLWRVVVFPGTAGSTARELGRGVSIAVVELRRRWSRWKTLCHAGRRFLRKENIRL